MSFYLSHPVDFEAHNAEVERVWKAYRERKPYRVPVSVVGSITNLFCNPEINTTGYTFRDFFENPQAQIEAQLAYQKWCRSNLLGDQAMGLPKDGWNVRVDFQNSYEAGWMGCPLRYFQGVVPDTEPILRERKERLYELETPDPLRGNLLGRAMEFFDYMQQKCPKMEFEGLPVRPPNTVPGEGTDGLFTLAYKMRGGTECCLDMMEDPGYYHDLMRFITESVIKRMKALREWRWRRCPDAEDAGKFRRPGWWFADDAIAVLSVKHYREFVLPYHRQVFEEFSDGSPISVHLCGDAARFFPILLEEFNAKSFDTGYPVPFGEVRKQLGPDVQIHGGPPVPLLKGGPPKAIRAEVRRICQSGIMEGGRFIMIAANNLAPCTPVEHVETMYDACKEFGVYG
jgi:uroporphyrinogen-III decarboxylase